MSGVNIIFDDLPKGATRADEIDAVFKCLRGFAESADCAGIFVISLNGHYGQSIQCGAAGSFSDQKVLTVVLLRLLSGMHGEESEYRKTIIIGQLAKALGFKKKASQ